MVARLDMASSDATDVTGCYTPDGRGSLNFRRLNFELKLPNASCICPPRRLDLPTGMVDWHSAEVEDIGLYAGGMRPSKVRCRSFCIHCVPLYNVWFCGEQGEPEAALRKTSGVGYGL